MKKSILMSILFLCLAFANTAWSLTITGGTINVGVQDTLIGQAHLDNSGDATELAWVKSIVGGTITLDEKYNSQGNDWVLTDAANVFALHLLGSPAYFLIKTGNVVGPNDHFLFENNGLLDWAVINVGENIVAIDAIQKVSHLDEFGTETTAVPEPGTFVLLGAGLFGLAIYGKRRRNA